MIDYIFGEDYICRKAYICERNRRCNHLFQMNKNVEGEAIGEIFS